MQYEIPEMEVMKLPEADIITLSLGDGDDIVNKLSDDWM